LQLFTRNSLIILTEEPNVYAQRTKLTTFSRWFAYSRPAVLNHLHESMQRTLSQPAVKSQLKRFVFSDTLALSITVFNQISPCILFNYQPSLLACTSNYSM